MAQDFEVIIGGSFVSAKGVEIELTGGPGGLLFDLMFEFLSE